MTPTDDKSIFRAMLRNARRKRERLPANSHVRCALSDAIIERVGSEIENFKATELSYVKRHPIFGFVCTRDRRQIAAFDRDIDTVIEHSRETHPTKVTRCLRVSPNEKPGNWYGPLFEIWAKATAVRACEIVDLDLPLASGRDRDIRCIIGGRAINIECTVITEDDEAREVWDRFLDDRIRGRNKSTALVRPGPYCPPDAKGPSPYYMPLRLYAKIYDKLTKNLDPTKSQCSENEPNIIALSFAGHGVSFDDPGVAWAVDELFADQPRIRGKMPEGFRDISLGSWMDFTAKELIKSGKMTTSWYCEHSNDVIRAPRCLAGVLLFDGCRLAGARLNYHADNLCRISHAEMAKLERMFKRNAPYWR